ncbi:MAG: stage III sporulation protein AA [Roseburia sp.]
MPEWKQIFPMRIRSYLEKEEWKEGLEEIRVRIGQPLEFIYAEKIKYLWKKSGQENCIREKQKEDDWREAVEIDEKEMLEMINYISNYSLYAFQQEIRSGYLTMEGGHRVGLAGKTVWEDGVIRGISNITFLNIRVAHEWKGCAIPLLPYLRSQRSIYNTLLLSAPGIGKTTYLRDCIRLLSEGEGAYQGLKVGVVDERSEIAACYMGIPQNDLGPRTDVLDGCGKEAGMQMLLRSMSPQIIAVDELGNEQDFFAVEQAVCSGSRVLGTIHAGDIKELWEKPYLRKWFEKKLIKRFVLLERNEKGERGFHIYNELLERIC